jgi:hypothetical protein
MTPVTYHTSRGDRSAGPAHVLDPCERRRIHGPIRPMRPRHGLLDWLLGHNRG